MRRWFHWKKRFYSFSLSACSVPAAFQKKLTRLSLLLHQRLWRKPDPRRSPIRRSSCHRQLDLWNQNAGWRSGLDPMQWHQSRSRCQAVFPDRKSSARSHRACAMHPGNREHPITGNCKIPALSHHWYRMKEYDLLRSSVNARAPFSFPGHSIKLRNPGVFSLV